MHIPSVRRVSTFVVAMFALSIPSFAQLRISVTFGPPALPVFEQPACPGDGYIWTPGYWAWSDEGQDYFWVPGTWVLAPQVGYFWTPPYWAWVDGGFVFYDGYWGPQVGFYGGINYGFGYFGDGFVGGRWQGGHFFYNREVTNVNVTVVRNVYNERVANNRVENRVSFNGGQGGVVARPTPEQEAIAHQRHLPPVPTQVQHVQTARGNRELLASSNHGKPPVAATVRPGAFSGHEATPAKEAGAPYNPPANRAGANRTTEERGSANGHPAPAVHPNDLPPMEKPAAPNTGDAKRDQKYQQQQQKLEQQQEKDRQKLQQQQEKEHQQLAKQNADDAKKQQMEQRHQQQTQQMRQTHQQQQEQLHQRQMPAAKPEGKPH
jgi:WXXGXW repeat (2 copies)